MLRSARTRSLALLLSAGAGLAGLMTAGSRRSGADHLDDLSLPGAGPPATWSSARCSRFQATPVDVLACKDGWCDVTFEGKRGFLMSEVVATGDPSKPAPGLLPQPAAAMVPLPKGPCFEVNQKGGNGGNAMTTVCDK